MDAWICETLRNVVDELSYDECQNIDAVDAYRWRVELVYHEMLTREASGEEMSSNENEALQLISEAHANMCKLYDCSGTATMLQASVLHDGYVGRPRFVIPCHQLEFLVQSAFSVPQIAALFCVSVSTIRRRMVRQNLTIRGTYSDISDAELDSLVSETQAQFPWWGNRKMYGYLLSCGKRVQFERVRESQRRTDPEGTSIRCLTQLRRRRYCVPGPQYLWHIDGNHKLIRYNNHKLCVVYWSVERITIANLSNVCVRR